VTERIYLRVSTEKQSIDRQRTKTVEYAQDEFGVELNELQFYRDKSTGTDTERDGYKQLMEDISDGDRIIVNDLSRLSRSLQDLQRAIERVVEDSGAEIHFIDERLVFQPDEEDPFQRLQLQLVGAFAEFEARIRQQRVREGLQARMENDEYSHGRAPIGFEKKDGKLYETERYDEVCAVLEMVAKDELSKRKAAEQLDCTRKTIRSAIEKRADLYGL